MEQRLRCAPAARGGKRVGLGPLGSKKGGARGELTGEAELSVARLQFRCKDVLRRWNPDRRQGGRGRGVPMAHEEEENGTGSGGDAAAPFQSGAAGI
jgi:hypothetical protein